MLCSGWYRGTAGRITSNGRTFGINPTNGYSNSPGMRHSLPQKVTVSHEHPFACAQLTFHILPLQINTLLYFNLSPQPVFNYVMYE